MKKKTVSHSLETLPRLTEDQLAKLTESAACPIDTSDIPEMTDEQWANAEKFRGRFYRPVKQQITARVDADVLDWLKAEGKGYQTRINEILRREMLATLKPSSSKPNTK
jgi:uncharacterized protein (DUF4415 family)